MIKQAIIPLAGLGTRLLPLTSVFAKELLPINGKPGLEYIIEECIEAGIKEIVFIISKKKLMIKKYFYNDKFYNEAIYAKEISKKLNTKHTELYIDAKQIIDVIDKLPTIYDEPFADSSQLPTYMLSKLAQQNVSVCLSGDGGDEIFCGYNRYIQSNKFIKGNFYFRKIISEIIFLLSPKQIERFYSLFKPLIIDSL